MHAFIATVPFTIIEAINFVLSNEIKDADLYLVKVFENAEQTGKRIEKTKIFRNVYILEDVLLTYPITFSKCVNVVRNGRKVINLLKDKKYKFCYYNNSGWLINSIFYTGFIKGNRDVKNIFLEHGYYSYVTDYADKPWYMRLIINMVGLKCMDGSMIDTLYMYEPELICTRYDGKIKKMKKLDKKNTQLVSALNDIFNYNVENNQYADKKIIIMEQGPMKVEFDKEEFWEKVFECIDLNETIIKAHPRQKKSTLVNCGAEISHNHTLPWEIEILNNDITNKIQITIFSGACVSPKLMFDDEPTVIFLYKLLPVDYTFLGKKVMDFADEIGKKYSDTNKYFIPESFDELKKYCVERGIGNTTLLMNNKNTKK